MKSHAVRAPALDGGTSLILHGGAWDIPDDACGDHADGLWAGLRLGQEMLREGAAAVDVVTETVAVLEQHGAFDAGCGSVLTEDGIAELDAGVMDGESLRYGAVINVQRLMHPIQVSRCLLEDLKASARILVGRGAESYAQTAGFDLVHNEVLIHPRERERFARLRRAAGYHTSHPFLKSSDVHPRGTVGCVARDKDQRLAAATSTGGTPFRISGRVGDSPMPGAGFYANGHGAASATGWGEAIIAMSNSVRVVDRVAQGVDPEAAIRTQLAAMQARIRNAEGLGATGGLILLNNRGEGAWAFTTPRMARGGWVEGRDPWVLVWD